MDLDLAQVRAFVEVAEQLHFGRAAGRLFLTQQALSKRIARLESLIGERLLHRYHQNVELTPAGSRFLPHARALLSAADLALRAARPQLAPLRIDVWGPVHQPLRLVREISDSQPSLVFELSMRRSLASSLEAVERGELDVAFGRPHDLGRPWPSTVHKRLIALEPIAAAVVNGHPLSDRPTLAASDLKTTGLWLPFAETPSELVGLLRSYADHLGVPVESTALNLGVEHTLADLRRHPHRVTPVGAQWELPVDIKVIPLRPTPCLPWSVVWRPDNTHPLLPGLLDRLKPSYTWDPARDWLPAPDHHDLEG